jgi:hypothetical protein
MRYLVLLLMFAIFCNECFAQDTEPTKMDSVSNHNKSQNSWKYFKLKTTIRGVVLEQHPTTVLCGYFATASNSIILTANNDTIRVLELCNTNKSFSKLDKVEIIPTTTPSFFVSFIPPTKFDEKVKRTSYGTITKIN